MTRTIFVDYKGGAMFDYDPAKQWNKVLRQLSVLAREDELDPTTVRIIDMAGNRLTVEFPGVKVLRSEFLAQAERMLNQPGFIDEYRAAVGGCVPRPKLYLPADRNSEPTIR